MNELPIASCPLPIPERGCGFYRSPIWYEVI